MSFVARGLLGVACVAWPTLALAEPAPKAALPAASPPVRLYVRNAGPPLTFSAQPESAQGTPAWCVSPCDVRLSPGDYRLKLNGRAVDDPLPLRQAGTLHGEYQSRAGLRSSAWLALNLGGIIGGVFITVGAASSSPTAFAIGGGVLVGSGAIFVITYRADRAKVSFTPDPPPDVRGMPEPATMSGSRQAVLEPGSLRSAPRGLGFRIAF